MTDPTDKKSKEKLDQSGRHESLHSRLNSIDRKSQERRDNSSVDLDAMLDEAESSLHPAHESLDEEDAIDRLLMNADFDDEALMPAEMDEAAAPVKDDGLRDELDDFLSFDDFDDDFNQPRQAPATVAGVDQTVQDSSAILPDDEDDLDRLLMNAGFDTDNEPIQPQMKEDVDALEELDDFPDFNNIDASRKTSQDSPAAADESQQTTDTSSAAEADEFFGLGDEFDESDLIQDDEVEMPAEADLTIADGRDAIDNLLQDAEPTLEQATGKTDDFPDLDGFSDDFDLSDLIQDDEIEAAADLTPPTAPQAAEPSSAAGVSDQADDLSVFGDDFDASDLIQDDEAEAAFMVNKDEINGLENDNIDSLLMDTEPDTESIQGQPAEKNDGIDDTELDDFFQLDEVSDDFPEQSQGGQLEKAEKPSDQDNLEDDFLLPDFDITADTEISDDMEVPDKGENDGIEDELANVFGDSDLLNEDEVAQTFEPKTAELKSGVNDGTAADEHDNIKFNPFEFEQEDLKKQLDEAEKKVKKAKRYSYATLGFGAVAISAAAGLGFMTYSAKTEVAKLTETVSTLEAKLAKNSANNPDEEINTMRNSVVQLNQQLDGFITELKGNPQFPIDLLNSKVPDIAVKQDMVSKALDMLQAKLKGEEKLSSPQPVIEPSTKAEAKHEHEHAPAKEEPAPESVPAKEASAHKITPAKDGTAHETASAKEGTGHEIASAKERTTHETAPTKERALHEAPPAKVEAVHETVPVKVKVQPEPVKAKPVAIEKAVIKEEPVSIEKPALPGKWGVNLVAVKQEWYANSKVAEFARRGIFAEIVPIQGNNTTMYRLRVGGFKSKAEANANTARIKRTLNLDSVWVSDD